MADVTPLFNVARSLTKITAGELVFTCLSYLPPWELNTYSQLSLKLGIP